MSEELVMTKAWIAKILLSDEPITTLIDDAIFGSVKDRTNEDLFITYQFVSSRPTKMLGRRRKLVKFLFDIKAHQKGGITIEFNTLITRIDELFDNFKNYQWRGWNFSSEYEDTIDLPNYDSEKEEGWEMSGGTYKISVYKL